MSIAVIIGVHDGVVLAADSASTLTLGGTAPQPGSRQVVGVLNVYDNANKIFNLYKGRPLGCITRRVSIALRHSQIEFTDFYSLRVC